MQKPTTIPIGRFGYVAVKRVHKINRSDCFFCSRLVYLRCVGGEVGATSSLAPKIGPLGLVSAIGFLHYFAFTKRHYSIEPHVSVLWQVYWNVEESAVGIKLIKIVIFSSFSMCSPQRKLVMILPRQPVTGKVLKSPCAWRSKIVKPPSRSFHQPPRSSSRHWKNHHVTERRSRTVSWSQWFWSFVCKCARLDVDAFTRVHDRM